MKQYTPGELADWLERKDLEYYSSDECYDMKREVVALLRKLEQTSGIYSQDGYFDAAIRQLVDQINLGACDAKARLKFNKATFTIIAEQNKPAEQMPKDKEE